MAENTSGQGGTATVPAEVDRWNWGAFLLTWIWGIGNNTLIALLVFLPVANIVMPFVLGAKGSAWAWRNKHWDSVEQFRSVQRSWARWGAIIWLAVIGLIVAVIFGLMSLMQHEDMGQWEIDRQVLEGKATGERFDIAPARANRGAP